MSHEMVDHREIVYENIEMQDDVAEDVATKEFFAEANRNVDRMFQPVYVFPGDDVTSVCTGLQKNITIGQGLVQRGESLIANQGGVLRYRPPSSYWIETSGKRYFPKLNDQVVGIVEERGGDYFKINIFSGSLALMNRLSFEGATKRNKPEMKKGDVVYCRVLQAHKDLETELTCLSASGIKKEWSSGEAVYGELPEGLVVCTSLGHAKTLLKPDCVVLNTLGKKIPFEVAVGMNGAIWVKAATAINTIIVRNAIFNSAVLDDIQTEAMIEALVKRAS